MVRAASIILTLGVGLAAHASESPYDLSQVEGMEHFEGYEAARAILARVGFVVVPTQLKQVFEPCIKGPLPPFVTVDSAWHTYHVLLEAGVRQLEIRQARRLLELSRRLVLLAWEAAGGDSDGAVADLAR